MRNKGGLKVLLVEDNPYVLSLLQDFLSFVGIDFISTDEGKGIEHLLKGNYFDMAILDYDLPDITGTELADIIKEKCPSCFIVLITGWPQLEEKKIDKVDYLLSKPFQLEELRSIIYERQRKKSS